MFEYLPALMQVGATLLSARGELGRGDTALLVGQRRKQLADFEAAQLEQAAGQSIAASQRTAALQARKTAYVN